MKDVSSLNSFFNDYFSSGKSLFLPFLPYSNLFVILPEGDRIIKFSTGHLIDIILLINIIAFIQRSGYHYFVKVCLTKNYINSYYLDYSEQICDLSKESNIFFGLNQDSTEKLQDQILHFKFKQNKSLPEIDNNINCYLRKTSETNYFKQNNRLYQISHRIYLDNFSSEFLNLLTIFLVIHHLCPHIFNLTNSYNIIQQEG
ncbi:MAG: hypothetical protein ACFFFB_16540 [Candidatus Heimdallarchaeota archaeon]